MPTLADAAGRWKAKAASAAASEFSLEPQPGKQTDFYNTKADICIFGGAAGAGKSRSLLLRAAKHIHIPGYGATIFRSTRPEITNEGGLWDESKKLYKDIPGVTFREGLLDWSFPAGSAISFAHSDRLAQKFVGSQLGFVGVDELQYWAEDDFWFLLSRNRTDCGVKPQLAATCNPNADSFVADLIAWWIDPEGYPIPERSGVLRYFYRFKRTIYWADTPEELMERFPELGKVAPPKSLTFISATIYDNPIFIEKNPEYLSSLLALPEVEMMRLLKGNWRITDSKASLFKLDKVSECAIGAWSDPIREDHLPRHHYLLCVDPNFGALGEDFYELQVWDITKLPYSLVYEFRDNEHGSEYHRERTLAAIDLYEPTMIVFEGNSGGKPMAESIQSDRPSYRVETVNTGRLSKVQNTDRVGLCIEQLEVVFPPDWIGIDEMRKFGKLTRTALSGHDDAVMCWAVGFAMIEEARSEIVDHSWILDSVQ